MDISLPGPFLFTMYSSRSWQDMASGKFFNVIWGENDTLRKEMGSPYRKMLYQIREMCSASVLLRVLIQLKTTAANPV